MTKRERRYHDRQKIIRTIRQATRIVMEAFQRYKERHMPVPKYPVGTLPERGMAIVGHIDSHRDVLPPAAFSIGLNVARLPKALFEDHKPVLVYAVDRDNGISQISISQMLQTLDYWAQNKEL